MIKHSNNFFLKKVLIFSFVITLFFISNISKASASTLYWYSTGGSTTWASSTNWWTDSAHTIQASVPTSSDDVILLGPVAPTAIISTWATPLSISSTGLTGSSKISGPTFYSTTTSKTLFNCAVTGNATFSYKANNDRNVILGNAIFLGGAVNSNGVVFGNATFYGTSTNSGNVGGNATFYNTSSNSYTNVSNFGKVSGNATFNDSSSNSGVISGNAIYNDLSYNTGRVVGNATYSSASSGAITLNGSQVWGLVDGQVVGGDGNIITSVTFNSGAINKSTLNGTTTFNNATNWGTTTDAVFNGTSQNKGVVTNLAIFNDTASNFWSGKIASGIFNGTSTNAYGLLNTATFNNNSKNYGNVKNNATFYDSAKSLKKSSLSSNFVIGGDAIFFGDTTENFTASITGNKIRHYTSSASTTRNFITNGPWTLIADGSSTVVDLSGAAYNASTTLQTINGGSFITTSSNPSATVPTSVTAPDCNLCGGTYQIDVNQPTQVQISNVGATTTSSSATINWNTDQDSNSIVYASNQTYQLTTGDGISTKNHTVTLNNLASCSTYSYVVSSIGGTTTPNLIGRIGNFGNGNIGISGGVSNFSSFTTTGCTGNATNLQATSTPDISTTNGGNITFNSGEGRQLVLVAPPSFTSTSSYVTFDSNRLKTDELLAVTSKPDGVETVDSNTYELKALTDVSTLLTTFAQPLSITMTYLPGDIDGLDPTSLKMYRYDNGVWTQLSGCSANSNNYTVTCTTDHFSVFSIFGYKISLPNLPTITTHHSGSRSTVKLATVSIPTYPLLTSNLPTVNSQLSSAEVAALKSQINAKIATLMQQLLKLLTLRLNALLGL
ncbi:MAG: hypothetical protein WCF92_02670 [bacterium]